MSFKGFGLAAENFAEIAKGGARIAVGPFQRRYKVLKIAATHLTMEDLIREAKAWKQSRSHATTDFARFQRLARERRLHDAKDIADFPQLSPDQRQDFKANWKSKTKGNVGAYFVLSKAKDAKVAELLFHGVAGGKDAFLTLEWNPAAIRFE